MTLAFAMSLMCSMACRIRGGSGVRVAGNHGHFHGTFSGFHARRSFDHHEGILCGFWLEDRGFLFFILFKTSFMVN